MVALTTGTGIECDNKVIAASCLIFSTDNSSVTLMNSWNFAQNLQILHSMDRSWMYNDYANKNKYTNKN